MGSEMPQICRVSQRTAGQSNPSSIVESSQSKPHRDEHLSRPKRLDRMQLRRYQGWTHRGNGRN